MKLFITNQGPEALTGESLDCFDNVNNILYVMVTMGTLPRLETGLYGFNLSDPTDNTGGGFIRLSQIYASNFGGGSEQCVGDTDDGSVYVFGHSAKNNTEQLLLKISRNPGNVSDVIIDTVKTYSNIDDAVLLPGEMSIFDSKRNKMWLAGVQGTTTEVYYYIDASTGAIEKSIPYLSWPIYSAGYDVSLDAIIGVSFDGWLPDNNAQYVMKQADPVTLDVTKTLPAFKQWCFWTSEGAINDDKQIWYQLLSNDTISGCRKYNGTGLENYLVGVDVSTGDITTAAPLGSGDANGNIIWDLFYWDGK